MQLDILTFPGGEIVHKFKNFTSKEVYSHKKYGKYYGKDVVSGEIFELFSIYKRIEVTYEEWVRRIHKDGKKDRV